LKGSVDAVSETVSGRKIKVVSGSLVVTVDESQVEAQTEKK